MPQAQVFDKNLGKAHFRSFKVNLSKSQEAQERITRPRSDLCNSYNIKKSVIQAVFSLEYINTVKMKVELERVYVELLLLDK